MVEYGSPPHATARYSELQGNLGAAAMYQDSVASPWFLAHPFLKFSQLFWIAIFHGTISLILKFGKLLFLNILQ